MTGKKKLRDDFKSTQEHMGRNTGDSSWLSVESEDNSVARSAPAKPVRIEAQQPYHLSHSAPLEDYDSDEVSPRQSHPPILKATIYDASDLQDLPDSFTRLPSACSWSSLRPSMHDGSDPDSALRGPSFSKFRKFRPRSPVYPLDSDICEEDGDRKESNATVFPSFPYSIKKSEAENKQPQGTPKSWRILEVYRAARDIYEVGPKGEGQEMWSSYKSRKQKLDHIEAEQSPFTPRKGPQHPYAPPPRPPRPQESIPLRRMVVPSQSPRIGDDSRDSRSSCEVPIRIGTDIQQAYKPLSRVPQLQPTAPGKPLPPAPQNEPNRPPRRNPSVTRQPAAVKSRLNLGRSPSKTLPPLPQPQPVSSSLQRGAKYPKDPRPQVGTNHVNTTAANSQHHIGSPPQTKIDHHDVTDDKLSPWWKSRGSKKTNTKPPTTRPDRTDKHNHKGGHDLKTQISRPRPITAIYNGRTANLPVSCGGVGGPGATTTQPLDPGHPALNNMTERQKGKQKATHSPTTDMPTLKHWRSKLHLPHPFADNRRDSDASFGCVGIEDRYPVYVADPGSSTQDGYGSVRRGDMRPEPLFEGARGGDGVRDTMFYEPYCDVLEEY